MALTVTQPSTASREAHDGGEKHQSPLTIVQKPESKLSSGIVQYALGKTLLPEHVAEAITSLSVVARVSLRATAFFLEAILEATKLSTGFGIGLTRRALIGAVGAARTMQALHGDRAEYLAIEGSKEEVTIVNTALFSILEKYTAVGIYVVHHTLTMTELMAISGLSLAQESIKTGAALAEESVQIFDGIFGSNETSRALSSFIDLVRKELTAGADTSSVGGLKTLAALTRSLTTFAVVQAATHRRTARGQRMKVLCDCTLLGTEQESSWRSMLIGPASFTPDRSQFSSHEGAESKRLSATSAYGAQGVPNRRLSRVTSDQSLFSQGSMSRSITFGADGPCLTDVASSHDPSMDISKSTSLMQGLDYYCGSDDEDSDDDVSDSDGTTSGRVGSSKAVRNRKRVSVAHLTADDDLPRTLRKKLSRYNDAELDRGVVIGTEGDDNSGDSRRVRQLVRRKTPQGKQSRVWEIVTETVEVAETYEETTAEDEVAASSRSTTPTARNPSLASAQLSKPGLADRLRNPFQRFKLNSPERRKSKKTASLTKSGGNLYESPQSDSETAEVFDEQEWLDVAQSLTSPKLESSASSTHPSQQHFMRVALPSEPNGQSSSESRLGQRSADSKERMSIVLKRVQRKFTKTTRVTTRVEEVQTSRPSQKAKSRAKRAKSITPETDGDAEMIISTPRQSFHLEVPKRQSSVLSSPTPHGAMSEPASPTKARRTRRQSVASFTSFTSRHQARYTSTQETLDPNQPAFPRRSLVDNLHRFGRFASASYGHRFMSILGIGDPYQFNNTQKTHANVWAFAHHVGVAVEDVLLSSHSSDASPKFHSSKMTPIINFVVVDRHSEAVVLACRGTLGLSDVLVDLTCEYEHIKAESGEGQVHGGIWQSASRLAHQDVTLLTTLKEALDANPAYGLVTVGHSLGGGVAALLALQWSTPAEIFRDQVLQKMHPPARHPPISTPFVTSFASGLPPGRPIHCYAYGPATIMDPDLSKATRGLITSLVHNHDVIPCLSLGLLRDLRNIGEVLDEAVGETASEILGRTIGLYRRRKQQRLASASKGQACSSQSCNETELEHGILPTDVPEVEKFQTIDRRDIVAGRTRNKAQEVGYVDPYHRETPLPGGTNGVDHDTEELDDWLWSLMKTMRAHAQSDKLYPPGRVYCTESFQVYVRSDQQDAGEGGEQTSQSTAMAHRVILRVCDDVVARFSEPTFSRTLFRDHSPSNLEFCLDLLKEAHRRPDDSAPR